MKGTRHDILSAAIKLFAQKGYAAASIREICQGAGITKPVLYYYFRSKEHLYQEVMLDIFSQTRKNLQRIAKMPGSLRKRLVHFISNEFRDCRKDIVHVRFIFRMMFSPEGEYPAYNFVKEFTRQRQVIAGFFAKEKNSGKIGRDPELLATALMGMELIAILEYVFTERSTLTYRNAERLVDLIIPPRSAALKSIPTGI